MEFIVLGFLVILIAFCVCMFITTSRIKKKQKCEWNKLQKEGVTNQFVAKHINGLPIAEGLFCTIRSYPESIEFFSGSVHRTLSREKITGVCVKTETDIQQQYVSSIGGAIGGAVLFGPLGAMIGGRAKKKTTRTSTPYLIISYKKDDTLSHIGFDVTSCLLPANRLAAEFHILDQNTVTSIEL